MAPVFSLGFVSVQKFEGAEKPTPDNMEAVFQKLPANAQKVLRRMEKHPFNPQNFRRGENGWRMIDYGDSYSRGYPLSYFLQRFHKEFEEALKETQTNDYSVVAVSILYLFYNLIKFFKTANIRETLLN